MAVQKTLDGYPQPFGSSKISVFPHVGPTSYVQVVAAAGVVPSTGGDTIAASEAGLKYFDTINDAISDDGCFSVEPIATTISNPSSGATSGIPSTTFKARWLSRVTATIGGQAQVAGTEVVAGTNLSAECVRLNAFGPK